MSQEQLEKREKEKKQEMEDLNRAIALSLESFKKDEPMSMSVIPRKYVERQVQAKVAAGESPEAFAESTFGISRKEMSETEWKDATNDCTLL